MAGIACGRFAATNFNELKTLIFSPLFVDECLKFVPSVVEFLSVCRSSYLVIVGFH
jgi:hypothetical protein